MLHLFGNKDKKEYIVAILLRHNDGQAYLLETHTKTRAVRIADQRAFTFTDGWDKLSYDIDELLLNIEDDNKVELKKAVFFIYSHLVDLHTREVISPYKEALKKIIEENNLESLGYLEMDQVLAKYLTSKEQSPLSATLIEIDTPAVSVFIQQAGEVIFSESVSRTENIVADLTEIFQHTQKDTTLPTRLVMYDSTAVQEEASKVIAHKWPKDVFMHVPKVDVMTETDFVNAILLEAPEFAFNQQESTVPVASPSLSDNKQLQELPQSDAEVESSNVIPDDLGFVIGADVKKEHLPEMAGTDVYDSSAQSQPYMSSITRAGGFSLLARLKSYRLSSTMSISRLTQRKPLIIGVFIVLAVIVASIAGLYYAHKASITVFYEKMVVTETLDFTNPDFIDKKTEEIKTSASIATTGKKKVGEKATGEVTIFNATEADKTFKKGTKLVASGNTSFILDADVTIKAATKTVTGNGDILTTTSKEKANVTAGEIGTSHNIAKDAKLTFEGSSDTTYFAKANSDFEGGSEKEIQTASKEDFKRIEQEIQEQINKKKADALADSANTYKVLSDLTEIELVEEDYSKEIAEEAKTLDAQVTAQVTFYLYDDTVVKTALIETLKDKVPQNYELKPEQITFTVASAEKSDEGVDLSLNATGEPSYKIDNELLISLIKGKSTNSVEGILKGNTDAKGFMLDVSSPFPFFRVFTPLFEKNYSITVKPIE